MYALGLELCSVLLNTRTSLEQLRENVSLVYCGVECVVEIIYVAPNYRNGVCLRS
jgi:hypothetical protein